MRSIRTLLALSLLTLVPSVLLAAEPSCPAQLDEANTHAALVSQSREQTELRLAQAIRGNRELSALAEKLSAQNKKLSDELAALKPKEEVKP
ncbi:MAG: hypothetical protein HQL97_00435 [Magnetococcales bacterium]|nr:hypothetical protein [Magnetococcales bacterium]